MSFFCLGDISVDHRTCTIMVSFYWALIYIAIVDVAASLYLSGYVSRSFRIAHSHTVSYDIPGTITGPDASGGGTVTIATDASGSNVVTTYSNYDQKTVDYLLKFIGIFNLMLVLTIIFICLKIFREIM